MFILSKRLFPLAFICLAAAPALADEKPDGTYSKSCKKIEIESDHSTMKAQCLEDNGKTYRNTTLKDFDACWANIYNKNGHLECTVPGGSYKETCRNAEMLDSTGMAAGGSLLVAQCKDDNGNYHTTSLAAAACDSSFWDARDIWNSNGVLSCDAPATSNVVPSGGNRGATAAGSCYPSC